MTGAVLLAVHDEPTGHDIWTVTFGQKNPDAHDDGAVLFSLQNWPDTHAVGAVLPPLHDVPVGHVICTVELGQKLPALHDELVMLPSGQNVPAPQVVLTAGVEQDIPTAHNTATTLPGGQNWPWAHAVGLMLLPTQTVPPGHNICTVEFGQ